MSGFTLNYFCLISDQVLNQQPLFDTSVPQFESFTNQVETPSASHHFQQPPPPTVTTVEPTQQFNSEQTTQNFSSVFSSLSNITGAFSRITGTANQPQQQEFVAPPPAGIETLIAQENTNVQPVPLFPATSVNPVPINPAPSQPPVNSGSVNTFRRATGLKRPTYAQIPNLVSSQPPPPQPQAFAPQQNLPPQPYQAAPAPVNFFQPPPSVSPASSTHSNQDPAVPYQFKPIAPTPSIPSPISQPLPTQRLPTLGHSQLTQPFPNSVASIPYSFSSPVMSAIPASEAMQSNLNMASSSDGLSQNSDTFAVST